MDQAMSPGKPSEDVVAESQHQLQQKASEQFSQGVADLFMAAEELRQQTPAATRPPVEGGPPPASNTAAISVNSDSIVMWQRSIDHLLDICWHLQKWALDAAAADSHNTVNDLHLHAVGKTVDVAQHVLHCCCTYYVEPNSNTSNNNHETLDYDEVDEEEIKRDAQGAIARIVHLNLILCGMLTDVHQHHRDAQTPEFLSQQSIVEKYVAYQRKVFRARAKPVIAHVVQERRQRALNAKSINSGLRMAVVVDESNLALNDDDNEKDTPRAPPQLFAPALTQILGQAAALLHPLATWMAHLPPVPSPPQQTTDLDATLAIMCVDAMSTIHDQAQVLAKTVSDWFWEDNPIAPLLTSQPNKADEKDTKTNGEDNTLTLLDALVEEMAYSCQVLARYRTLIERCGIEETEDSLVLATQILPEWTVQYGALERALALRQWELALSQAVPVTIVIGTTIRVPSVVEDAQYLSTRALERAARTGSLQAVATCAHAITHDVWSTEVVVMERQSAEAGASAVYQALLDQMGCWIEPRIEKPKESAISPAPKSGDFASALLDALDDDIATTTPTNRPAAAPSSGNFLASLVTDKEATQQRQLDTLYCLLNGMHAASGASRSLVAFLDGVLSDGEDEEGIQTKDAKAVSMIQLSREELSRYSDMYQTLLSDRLTQSLRDWCGGWTDEKPAQSSSRKRCFDELKVFIDSENYNLDGNSIVAAEADTRLEKNLLGPFRESVFLNQLPSKGEAHVLELTAERVAVQVVDVVLHSLWNDSSRKCTDWGALLLSKQIRMLQNFISEAMILSKNESGATMMASTAAAKVLGIWERLSQVVTVLQLEKPSDWLVYQSSSILTPDEVSQTLALRIDFKADVISTVVSSIRAAHQASEK